MRASSAEDAEVLFDLLEQLRVLVDELFLLEIHELAERHLQNGFGLHGRERILFGNAALVWYWRKPTSPSARLSIGGRRFDRDQAFFGFDLRFRSADDADHFVDIGVREQQALHRVLAAAGAEQQELRPPANDDEAMPHELLQHLLQRERARFAVDQREQDDRERILQRREFVELVEDDVRIGVLLQVDDDPHRLFEIALVAHAGDARDAAFVGDVGDLLDDGVARLLIRNVVDDDPVAVALALFDRGLRADDDRAAARFVTFPDGRFAADDAAGREVGAGDVLHQLLDGDVRVVDERDEAAANFAQVVRRDRRGHADGDAARAVHEQVGELRRQHGRLGVPFVVRGNVVDGVELEVFEHRRREGREAGFRVPHGGRREAGDRAEVALLVDQHGTACSSLGPCGRAWGRSRFAVRMVVTAGVAGDLRALHAARAGREIQVVHRHENAALRRLEAVAHIGQRAAHDDAHRVREVALLQLIFDRQIDEPQRDRLRLRIFGRGWIGRTGGHKQILSADGSRNGLRKYRNNVSRKGAKAILR